MISRITFAFLALFILQSNTLNDFTPKKHSFEFTYAVTLTELPSSTEEVEIFIPVPPNTNHQKIKGLTIQCPYDYSFQTDPTFNNKILHVTLNDNISDTVQLSLQVKATRYAILNKADYDKSRKNLQNYLRADSLVPLDSTVQQEAFKVANTQMSPQEKSQAFYDHLIKTMEYDKSGEGWGRGDAIYACQARKGNCTDFHSLFIGMSRVFDLPARFKIGFPLPTNQQPGTIGGYHCWAEYYIKDQGWAPVDISEAAKHPEKREFFYGSLDAYRLQFSMGRDITITTDEGRKRKLNYLIYPYVLVNNRTYNKVSTEFHYSPI